MAPSDPRPRVTKILASAGSGKTFALTSRYLALVHSGVDPGRILATTFSRAAAAEILGRVLRRAALAVLEDDKRKELARSCEVDERDFDEAAASKLLSRVVRALPRSQIRTLDSFFASVVSAFANELGLASMPRVLEEGEERTVLLESIRLAMEVEDETALLRTILSLSRGRRVAAVVRATEEEVQGLLAVHAESEPDAWTWAEPRAPSFEEQSATRDGLLEAMRCDTLRRDFPTSVLKDLAQLERAIESGGAEWDPVEFGSLVTRAIAARGDASVDITFHGKTLPQHIAATYRELARIVLAENEISYARMTGSMRDLAAAIAAQRSRHTRAKGLAGFSDLTALLDPRANQQPELGEVWFRIDGRIQHLLLDEFQDTSVIQWRALQRLVEEIVTTAGDDRSLFVVGDVKQAIYGWRGGEPRLLAELDRVLGEIGPAIDIEPRELLKSYRSSRSVIAFVNRVFGRLAGHRSDEPIEQEAVLRWAQRFAPHETSKVDIEGFAEVVAVPFGDGGHPDKRAMVAEVRKRVRDARNRMPDASIGVIVRANRSVARIARALQRDGHAVRVVGFGALLDREAPLCFLQALRLAEWPGDTVAAFDLAHSPLASLIGLDGTWQDDDRGRSAAASASRRLRRSFEIGGIAATVDSWRRAVEEQCDEHERMRLFQLVAVLDRLESGVERSPGEIAALAMKARVEHSAGGEVAVMNVHQSKGLEFDAVVVTDLEGALEGNTSRRRLAWSSPARPTDRIPRVVRWLKRELRDVIPAMGLVCDDTSRRQVEESLSVLYVALTRARREVSVVVSSVKHTKKGDPNQYATGTLATVVRLATDDPAPQLDPTAEPTSLLTIGARTGMPAAPIAPAEEVARPNPLRIVPALRPRRRARPPSLQIDRANRFRLRDRAAMDRGTAFHAALATIDWLEVREPDLDKIRAAIRAALPECGAQRIDALVGEIVTALARPELRRLLTCEGPRSAVRNEHAFVRVTAGGIVEGSIDRLVLEHAEDGSIARAVVIDYKTDAVGRDELPILIDRHSDQLRAYRDVIVEQFGLAPGRVLLRLFSLTHDVLVEVPSR